MSSWEVFHAKFMGIPTSGIVLLAVVESSFEENPLVSIHKVADYYNEKVQQKTADENLHEAYHTLLCFHYQLLSERKVEVSAYPNELLLKNLIANFSTYYVESPAAEIRHEITVLQMVLYLNIDQFQQLFLDALAYIHDQVNAGVQINYALIETFLDTSMYIKRENSLDPPPELTDVFRVLLFMIDEKNPDQWDSFTAVLNKTISIYPSTMDIIWLLIRAYSMQEADTKSLPLMYALIDSLLSQSSTEAVSMNVRHCSDEMLLMFISHNLESISQQYRVHAQYVFKRMIEYLRKHSTRQSLPEDTKFPPPFVFCKSDFDLEESKNVFFDLLQSLEQKRPPLALPTIIKLQDLMKTDQLHQLSLTKVWLRCIFTRILTHSDPAIVKEGLNLLLRMDLPLFDDGFIGLLVYGLNNTYIYDDPKPGSHVGIFQELSDLFRKAEHSDMNFIRKFIIAASKPCWLPIPLFYLFEVLGKAQKIQDPNCRWGTEELAALMSITECSVYQIRVMKLPTQTNILKVITSYVKPSGDCLQLGKILALIDDHQVLVRGNANWELLADYLKCNLDERDAGKYISEWWKDLQVSDTVLSDIRALAILCVLLCDTESMIFKATITANLLCPLFMPIVDAAYHETENSGLLLRALKMITCLVNLTPRDHDEYVMFILGFFKPAFDFIINTLFFNWPETYEKATVHVEALASIIKLRDLGLCFQEVIDRLLVIAREDIELITFLVVDANSPVLRSWYAMNVLNILNAGWEYFFPRQLPIFVSPEGDTRVVSECYGLLATLYKRYTEAVISEFSPDMLMGLAQTKSNHAIKPIAEIMYQTLGRGTDDATIQIIMEIIDICWGCILEANTTKEMSAAARALISLILSPHFYQSDWLQVFGMEKINALICKTDSESDVRYILFSMMTGVIPEYKFHYHDPVLAAFLVPDVHAVISSAEMQACCYTMNRRPITPYVDHDGSVVLGFGLYTEVITRSVLVSLMLAMNDDYREELAKAYIPQLILMLEERKNETYSANSYLHRLKLRVMQVLLIIRNDGMYDYLSTSIVNERDQPSVRIMKEWILILIYIRKPLLKEDIWKLFAAAQDGMSESRMSLTSIVHHVAHCLTSLKNAKATFVKRSIRDILCCCLSQESTFQWYTMTILSTLLEINGQDYKMVKQVIDERLQHSKLKSKSVRMFEDFYFKAFHPLANLTLQTIFHELPRLLSVCVDEWIRPQLFERLVQPGRLDMQIYNSDRRLSDIRAVESYIEHDGSTMSAANVSGVDSAETQEVSIGMSLPVNDVASISMSTVLRRRLTQEDFGIIVVATLVESFTNLGTLARTADIFCAREMVMKNKRCTENKDFQSVSVTAERSIPMTEVRPHELKDYLLGRKSCGWQLVGVKQTNHSVSLLDVKFLPKTVLVLGSEKMELPEELSRLMDVCVMVPQAGVFKSPHVHIAPSSIAGALCLWQYAQQHIFKRMPAMSSAV